MRKSQLILASAEDKLGEKNRRTIISIDRSASRDSVEAVVTTGTSIYVKHIRNCSGQITTPADGQMQGLNSAGSCRIPDPARPS